MILLFNKSHLLKLFIYHVLALLNFFHYFPSGTHWFFTRLAVELRTAVIKIYVLEVYCVLAILTSSLNNHVFNIMVLHHFGLR